MLQLKGLFIAVMITSALASVENCRSVNPNESCIVNIPGTHLTSYTFYTMSVKRFSTGTVKKSLQVHNTMDNHVVTERQSISCETVEPEQWLFAPAEKDPGWFTLANRGNPWLYANIITSENGRHGVAEHKYFVLLNRNYSANLDVDSRSRYLWKPVQATYVNGTQWYRIKSKAIPNGMITWTERLSTDHGHFIQVDNSGDNRYADEWYDDTLFSFIAASGAKSNGVCISGIVVLFVWLSASSLYLSLINI